MIAIYFIAFVSGLGIGWWLCSIWARRRFRDYEQKVQRELDALRFGIQVDRFTAALKKFTNSVVARHTPPNVTANAHPFGDYYQGPDANPNLFPNE